MTKTHVQALMGSPSVTSNTFEALDKGRDEVMDAETVEALNGWAHKVHRSAKKGRSADGEEDAHEHHP